MSVYGRAQSQNLFITSLLPMKVIFDQNSSSIEGCLTSMVVLYRSSSSIEGCHPLKVVFHRRSSSIKGCLPSKVGIIIPLVEVNQAIISLVVQTKIEVGAMSDRAGGCNQKPLIGARASALPKNRIKDHAKYFPLSGLRMLNTSGIQSIEIVMSGK